MKKVGYCLLLFTVCSCRFANRQIADYETYCDSVLDIQDEVIARVDTFFLSFSEPTLTPDSTYVQLLTYNTHAIKQLETLSNYRQDASLKQASLYVCEIVRDLSKHEFQQLLDCNKQLNKQEDNAIKDEFERLSKVGFDKLESAQDQFDQVYQEFLNRYESD